MFPRRSLTPQQATGNALAVGFNGTLIYLSLLGSDLLSGIYQFTVFKILKTDFKNPD